MILSTNNRVFNLTRAGLFALALLFALVACSDRPGQAQPGSSSSDAAPAKVPALRVVTTTGILADWVRNIGGDHVEVFSLVPSGADPHSFQPGARGVTKIADADLVLSVGLGLEGSWLKELLQQTAREPSTLVELGVVVDPIELVGMDDDDQEEDKDGDDHGLYDPHFWFDPIRVKLAVAEIADRLSVLDPKRADAYRANAAEYNSRLEELHVWTEQQVNLVPEDRRLLVTSHDSLGYFADRYGFEVVGFILSITTEVEPSAVGLADLVEEVRRQGAPAVFGETTVSERLANALAAESGVKLVRLYSGSLGPEGSGSEVYLGMARQNVKRITEALR